MAPGQAKSADDSLSKEIELFTKLAGPAVLGQLFMFLLWMQNAMVGDINNACKDNTRSLSPPESPFPAIILCFTVVSPIIYPLIEPLIFHVVSQRLRVSRPPPSTLPPCSTSAPI